MVLLQLSIRVYCSFSVAVLELLESPPPLRRMHIAHFRELLEQVRASWVGDSGEWLQPSTEDGHGNKEGEGKW